jgi:hypothetical protein
LPGIRPRLAIVLSIVESAEYASARRVAGGWIGTGFEVRLSDESSEIVAGAFSSVPLAEANHALHLAEALTRHGVDVHVLTARGAVTDGLPFTVHAVMRAWSWRDAPRFVRFLRRCRPDATCR